MSVGMDQRRKDYLIAKALWESVAQDGKKPVHLQCRSDVHDMEAKLDNAYPSEADLLMRAETVKDRS